MIKKLLYLLALVSFTSNAQFWTQYASSFSTASRGINSICIVDANTIWAKAYDGSGTGSQTVKDYTKSIDGGLTWTSGTMSLGVGTSGLGIANISAVSATTAWISAYPATANLGGVWKTTNGGTSWTKQSTALFSSGDSWANFVHFWDTNNGVCQGDPDSGYFEIYTTTNGGTNWTRVPSANIPTPLSGEYGYSNDFNVVGNIVWFGTNKGRIFKSINNGLNWTVAQSPVTDTGGCDYSFFDANNGLFQTSTGVLYKSIDGGVTWTTQTFSGTMFVGQIVCVPGTNKVVSASAGTTAGSSYSLDGGLTWIGIDTIQHLETVFLNASVGFSGGFNTNATTNGIFKYTGTVLNNSSFEKNNFSIYPNPVSDVLTISSDISIEKVSILDINGRTIKSINTSTLENIQINVSDLITGIYFIDINTKDGNSTQKFIKK